jgi:hypothetical protein
LLAPAESNDEATELEVGEELAQQPMSAIRVVVTRAGIFALNCARTR